MNKLSFCLLVLISLLLISLSSYSGTAPVNNNHIDTRQDAPLGFPVSTGAAVGYVDDKACAVCHNDLYQSYQSVGMAMSFKAASLEHTLADYNAKPLFHAASQRYYQMRIVGKDIVFKRYQRDADGNVINLVEQKVDWFLGSGNKVRSYLYQTNNGELFLLPLDWYSETKQWQMHPGFEAKNHQGVLRQVNRECMFCHNAFPQVETGSDIAWKPHTFPKDLPHGTGCQRCHGPGAKHMGQALNVASPESIRSAITNPARLPDKQRDSVCFQCHLLPSGAIVGQRRFERPVYSFRPGEILNDYLLHVDVVDSELPKKDRFEINHHGYRFLQSECFQKSEGKLACISCHDPHKKVSQEDRAEHFSAVCKTCHIPHEAKISEDVADSNDCTACHMPKRRTQDVVHAVMTDHRIQINTTRAKARLAAIEKIPPRINGLDFLFPELSPKNAEGEVYKAVSVLHTYKSPSMVDKLTAELARANIKEITPWLTLANAQISLKRFKQAEITLQKALKLEADNPKAKQLYGIVMLGQGKTEQAERYFQQALVLLPTSADIYFNYGLLQIQKSDYKKARKLFNKALAQRHNLAIAWFYLGYIAAKMDDSELAIEQFQQALAIEPTHTRSYIAIADAYLKLDKQEQALRYLKHGLTSARQPKLIEQKLAVLTQAN
ncbi:Flp pilus assembly protein TadD [Shewanella psychrophila]|uniref:Flp pilus assembly protein TadD n=2 Tax=Shewanella psychrophila TaxID=225848 RepID=A0A1S6HNV1_9GAMM|nr:Flp pilus assembly protein TadD [Shewanella psychrophila]